MPGVAAGIAFERIEFSRPVLAQHVDFAAPRKVSYSIAPAGVNINRAFPFAVSTLVGQGWNGVGAGQLSVAWDGSSLNALFLL